MVKLKEKNDLQKQELRACKREIEQKNVDCEAVSIITTIVIILSHIYTSILDIFNLLGLFAHFAACN